MLGKDHALLGATATLAALDLAGTSHLGPATAGMALIVGVGAALAPDLDEPGSLAGRGVAPLSHVPGLFGPHRRRTHSLLAVAAVTGVALWAAHGHLVAAGVLSGLLAACGAGAYSKTARRAGWVVAVPFGAFIGWILAAGVVHVGTWLPASVAAGLVSHLVGDGLTPGGVPWLWPAPWRGSLSLFRTGSAVERWVVHPILWAGTAVVAYVVLGPVVGHAVHHGASQLTSRLRCLPAARKVAVGR